MRFPFRVGWNSTASYVGLLLASFALALFTSYILGSQLNIWAYDAMYRASRPPAIQPESVVLAIDELTLVQYGGIRGIRRPIAEALRILAPAKPKVVAIDVYASAARQLERELERNAVRLEEIESHLAVERRD